MANSIGSLYIDIQARTAQMETDLGKVKALVAGIASTVNAGNPGLQQMGDNIQASFTKGGIALGLLTIAISAAKTELQEVATNITSIPSVPQSTIDSIQQMNYELALSKRVLDQAVASIEDKFSQVGQGIGYGLGSLVYGADAASDAYGKMAKEAQAFADIDYNSQIAALQEQLNAINAETAAEKKLKDIRGQRVDYLLEEAALLRAVAAGEGARIPNEANLANHPKVQNLLTQYSSTGGMTLKDVQNANIMAAQAQLAGDTGSLREYKAKNTAMDAYVTALDKVRSSQESLNDQLDDWQTKLKNGTDEMRAGYALVEDGKLGEGYQKEAEGYKAMAKATAEVASLQHQIWDQFDNAIASDFGDAIKNGETLNTLFHKIGQTIEDELIKRLITQPISQELFGLFTGSGGIGSLFSGSSAADNFSVSSIDIPGHASGGPVNAPTLVGELGPELFVPPSGGGTIVPNHELRSGEGSGGGLTVVYNIQSGVTRNELAPILDSHAKQIKGDISNVIRRGGARARAFATA